MTETWDLPQPWEHTGQTQAEYTAWALEQEANGRRLVIDTYYDGYPDGGDGLKSWMYDAHVLTDYRTGHTLYVLEFEAEPPATADFENLLPVELVLAEA